MDAAQAPLRFAESLPFAGFVVCLCMGLAVAFGVWRLRPWPPSRGRLAATAAVALVCALIALAALQQRTVWIDPVHQRVQVQHGLPGLARAQDHPFSQIEAVVVRASARDGGFELGLDGVPGWIALRRHADVAEAEAQAIELSALAGWPARRRDYRFELRATGGELEPLETADGRPVMGVEVAPLRQLVFVPGADGDLR